MLGLSVRGGVWPAVLGYNLSPIGRGGKKISLRLNVEFPCKLSEETVTSNISPVSLCILQCPPKV